jgi:hypothetical protein
MTTVSIPARKLSKLSNGTYYLAIHGESGSKIAVSKPQMLIILK